MRLGSDVATDGANAEGDGERTELDPRCVGICGLSCCAVAIALALLSMAVIHPTQYGLVYNHFWLSIAKEPEPTGRRFIGPWSSIVLFNSTVQTIEFSARDVAQARPLKTRTDEGLDLTLHVAFQYKLLPGSLYKLYNLYKTEYQPIFLRQAASLLLSVASNYEAEKYWTARPEIGEDMLQGLKELFQEEGNVTELELMIVELPDSFENKIVDTEVMKQIRKTREAEQQASVIRAQNKVILADYTKQQQIILNTGIANATLLTRTAQAKAQKARIDVETQALNQTRKMIPLTPEGLVAYQRGIAYQNVDNAQFMFGVQQAAAIVNTGAPVQQEQKICEAGGSAVRASSQPSQMLFENLEKAEAVAAPVLPAVPAQAAEKEDAPAKKRRDRDLLFP